MTITSLKNILINAQIEGYAVGSFNVLDLHTTRAVIIAAEEENSPVIIAFGEGHEKFVPMETIIPIMKKLAIKSKVPVAVILDHGSYEANIKAMNLGTTGVMYDGSSLIYEKNVENTRKIVEIAKILGISVEAELGHVSMEGGNPDNKRDNQEDTIYTEPSQVQDFVSKTDIDALAISIGTIHGVCLKEPKIDFNRLKLIREITDVPLVLHGGSGVSDKDFKECIKYGITKINYFSNISNLVAETINKNFQEKKSKQYYQDIIKWTEETFKNRVKNRMNIFGSANKA